MEEKLVKELFARHVFAGLCGRVSVGRAVSEGRQGGKGSESLACLAENGVGGQG